MLSIGKRGQVALHLMRFLWVIFNENKLGSAQIEQMMRNERAEGRFLSLTLYWVRRGPGKRRGAGGPLSHSLFLSSGVLLFFLSLSITFSALLTNHMSFSLPFTVSASEWPCIFPAVRFPHNEKKEKEKKCKTNHSDALHNLINEAWENLSHNTCLHKIAQGDWLLPDAAGCLWTKRTHTCNPFGFGATLSIWWVPTERSLGMTDCTLTLQGVEERYSLFMKSKMENPFSQADS